MGMENYNPPQEPWLVILYQDEHIMVEPGSGRLASGCPAFDRCDASVTEPKMGMENYNPPQEPWLVILYQDDHIMVVNKPSGLLSVPGRLDEHKDSVMTRIQRDYPQAESVHLDQAGWRLDALRLIVVTHQ